MTDAVIGNLKLQMDDSLPLREVVFHTLRDAILEGTLPPGTRLMELQLSSQLGVSRTPVREAIRLLSMEGLVKASVRRGTVVEPIRASDLRDALEVREALEELAVRKACRNMDQTTLQMLRDVEDQFEQSLTRSDAQASAKLDVHFHEVITEAAHNRRLTQSLTRLREELYRYRLENLKDEDSFPLLIEAHRALVSAFESRDEEEAVRVLRDHIETQAKVLMDHIREE